MSRYFKRSYRLFLVDFPLLILFGILSTLALGQDIRKEIESAKEQVHQLELRAYEDNPALQVLEQMQQEAREMYKTDEYQTLQKQTLRFLDSVKNEKQITDLYHKMRAAYRSIADYQAILDVLKNDLLKSQLLSFWRSMLGERAESMSDAELEAFMINGMKEDAEHAQNELDKVTQGSILPSYVMDYCRLWAKAETRQGGTQKLIEHLTPKELTNTREHLNRLQIQTRDLAEQGEREAGGIAKDIMNVDGNLQVSMNQQVTEPILSQPVDPPPSKQTLPDNAYSAASIESTSSRAIWILCIGGLSIAVLIIAVIIRLKRSS